MVTSGEWQQCNTKVFWGDIAHDDHVVQIYDDDAMLLNTLADFAMDGFNAGNSVIVIATKNHLDALHACFGEHDFNLDTLMADDQYIPLDADQTLAKFMVNGQADEKYFMETVIPIMKRARKNNRQVRAFGEMVALLWERGNSAATIELEHLWNRFSAIENFCLFCAYPKNGFTNDAAASVMHICNTHSKIFDTDKNLPSAIQYKHVN